MFFSAISLTASNTDAEGVIVWTAGSDFDLSISLTGFTSGYAAIVVPEDAVRVHCGGNVAGIGLLGWVLVIAPLVTVLFALVQLLMQRGLGAVQRSSSSDGKASRVRE
jgi:hypothetical protein